jgi:hypothetical protein
MNYLLEEDIFEPKLYHIYKGMTLQTRWNDKQ